MEHSFAKVKIVQMDKQTRSTKKMVPYQNPLYLKSAKQYLPKKIVKKRKINKRGKKHTKKRRILKRL